MTVSVLCCEVGDAGGGEVEVWVVHESWERVVERLICLVM